MWHLKYDTNELINEKQKQTHRHREQICGCQGGGSLGLADTNYYT